MVLPLPQDTGWGFVTGRVVHFIADTDADEDDKPEARPATGSITFTPSRRVRKTVEYSAFALQGPESVRLATATDSARAPEGYTVEPGEIIDAEGRPGVWLVEGVYAVTFNVDGGSIPGFHIEVTSEHTRDNPLDLAQVAPGTPSGTLPEWQLVRQAVLDAAQSLPGATVTSGEVVGDDLVLTRTNGETVNAGNVRGPHGIRVTTTADGDFNALDTGIYYVPTQAQMTALGLPGNHHGLLHIVRAGTAGAAYWTPRGGSTYRLSRSGGVWQFPWRESPEYTQEASAAVARIFPYRLTLGSETDFEALGTGVYYVAFAADATALGLPVTSHGLLTVVKYGSATTGAGAAFFQSRDGGSWRRSRVSGTWQPWIQDGTAPGVEVRPDYSIRHAAIRDRHAASIAAPIDVGEATPVAFVWDDWPALMRDLGIVTMAETYEVPITLALASRTLEEPYASILGGVGITWSEIDAWVQGGWVELANHSATHSTAAPAVSFYDEIVTSRHELEAHSPTKPVATWVMPTVSWPGFQSGSTPDEWAGEAGQLILGHHVYATGKMPVLDYRTQPMTGTPIQGQDRIWVESADLTVASRQGLITRHYGTNRGVIISAHANNIGKPGRWDVTDVEAFFAWLAAEATAGRIRPMFLSEWAWARSSNPAE